MVVNYVRLFLSSGATVDVDAAHMLNSGKLDTDSFDAAGEGALAIKRAIKNGHGLDTPMRNGWRTMIVIEPKAVLAFEEREQHHD